MSPAPFATPPWGCGSARGHQRDTKMLLGVPDPMGNLSLEPCGAPCPQRCGRSSVPKPCLKGTGTFPSSCTQGQRLGAGDNSWDRVSCVLMSLRTCPAPTQDRRCVPSCPRGAVHSPGQRPVPCPRGSEGTHRPVPLPAQGQECDIALRVQAQPLAALGARHRAPAATVLRQRPLQRPPVVHVPGVGDRRVLVPRAR